MKLKNKRVAKPVNKKDTEKELKALKEQLALELKELHKQEDIVFALKRSIFDLEYAPFKEGDTVVVTVYLGGKKKDVKCVLEARVNFDEYEFIARPIKSDGSLSARYYKVYNKDQLRYE